MVDLMKVQWREFTQWYGDGDGEIWSSKLLAQLWDRVPLSTECVQLVKVNYRLSKNIISKM